MKICKEIEEYCKKNNINLEDFDGEINWNWISQYQDLSEEFINKYYDKVNWDNISKYQTLSEKFIEEYRDYVNWDLISPLRVSI